MFYKGNDLDLRVSWRTAHDRMRSENPHKPHPDILRGVPIAVDQTVLACCNGAYDAAVFFGTREVRPEHLLYALTRVDGAREALEQHGIHTQQLRRETAAMMSTLEPPGGAWDGRGVPSASPELEDLLRRAASRAGQDGAATTVHDLLRAVLNAGRETGLASIILHAAADPQGLERWAMEAQLPLHMSAPPSLQLAQLQPDVVEKLAGRMEQMEASMRALVAEVSADRKAMLDLLGELQEEMRSARTATAGNADLGQSLQEGIAVLDQVRTSSPDVDGRLAALETRITAQPPAIAEAVAYMLGQKADGIGGGIEGAGGIATKLADVETALRAQAERMEEAGKTHEHDLSEIYEALVKIGANQQTLATNLETWRLDSGGDIGIVSNRVESLEKVLRAVLPRPRPEPQPVQPSPEPARMTSDDLYEGEPPTGSFKRWLFGTTRVLPASWREDMSALRDSVRRRNGGG
jgi:hypothetical protein